MIFNWETSRSTPRTDANLKQLASVLGVSEDYFIENSEITSNYSKLTQANKDKIVALSDELLAEQGNQTSELHSYKTYEGLSVGTGYSYFGDGLHPHLLN